MRTNKQHIKIIINNYLESPSKGESHANLKNLIDVIAPTRKVPVLVSKELYAQVFNKWRLFSMQINECNFLGDIDE